MVIHEETNFAGDVAIKVFSDRLALNCPCNCCTAEGHSSSRCPKHQKLWCEDCKSKVTELATSAFALFKRESTLSVFFQQTMSLQDSSIKGKSQTSPLSLTNSHEFSKKIDRAKPNSSTRVSDVLEGITRHLIQVLRETSKPDLRYFKNYIDKFDDPDDLCIALLDYVDPKIRGLEDKAVTPGLLKNIRCQKADGEIFDGIGGYFDSLTDDREDNYCRLYVEQSTNVRSRSRGHVVPLLSDSVEPLHYYIYALSKCSRKSHFLQLFRFPATKFIE